MKNQQWLMDGFLVGFSTVIVGGTAFLIPADDSRAVLVGSMAGASTGAAILAKRRENQCKEEKVQFKQVVSSLANLELLTAAVKFEQTIGGKVPDAETIDRLKVKILNSAPSPEQFNLYPLAHVST